MDNPKTILIVEDEKQLLRLVSYHLEKVGYEVYTAQDGKEAFEILKKIIPDLIILDIVLPGMGGYEICARVRSQEPTRSIPIIMFSSRSGDIDKHMGFQCGANDYIVKPYDPKVLLERIKELLA